MTKKFTLAPIVLLFLIGKVAAQESYFGTAGEMIFSYGEVHTDSTDLTPIVRWTPFFNLQGQFHHDFSEKFGIYTGLGVRNVGLISHIDAQFADTGGTVVIAREITVKERAYSLGVPLAIKFGNLQKQTYVDIGAEAEVMMNWRRKIIDEDQKEKVSGWFDDHLTIFNPSAFLEFHFAKGQYIRLKYYMLDFLNYTGITLVDRDNNKEFVADYGSESPLFYISIGTVKLNKMNSMSSSSSKPKTTTYFKSDKNDVNWSNL